VQELGRQEDCDERRYQVPVDVAVVQLVHRRWIGNDGRVEEGERGGHVDAIPRIVLKGGGGDVERNQDGDDG
jgi:hypothetical protein